MHLRERWSDSKCLTTQSAFRHVKLLTDHDGIKDLEKQIAGTTMMRTHKSYLANLQHIRKLFWDEMQMTNGAVLPLGRKYIPAVKDAYNDFIKKVTIDRNK